MLKPYILYHANCYDGFGAAFAAWLHFQENAVYLPVKYGEDPPEMGSGSTVYIVDFSYPKEILRGIAKQAKKVVLLDHHQSAQHDLQSVDEPFPAHCHIVFDLDESGATMAWDYFHPDRPRPDLFAYIKDRDLWRLELPESREINAALRSVHFDFGHWMALITDATQLGVLATKGRVILAHQDALVAAMATQTVWRTIGGYDVPTVNATVYFSEVGDYLCQQYSEAPFAAYYLLRHDGKIQFGLRSRNNFDVSIIAKSFGGGGHKQAAGFVLDKDQFVQLMFSSLEDGQGDSNQ